MYSSIYNKYPDIMTVKEVQELIGNISQKTIYRWIQTKKIPCFRLGKSYFIPKSELIEQLVNCQDKRVTEEKKTMPSKYHPRKRR